MLSLKEAADRKSANTWFINPFRFLLPKKKKSLNEVSSDAVRMLNWMRHYYLLNQLPATTESLDKLTIGDLRLIASIFKPYVQNEMRDATREDFIRFIAGHQRDIEMYRPLEPLPFGSLPELETASI